MKGLIFFTLLNFDIHISYHFLSLSGRGIDKTEILSSNSNNYVNIFSGWTLAVSATGAVLALINAIIIGIGLGKNFKPERPPSSQLDMEIHVNGSTPGIRSSTLSMHTSGDQGSRWQIQKKQQQKLRRDSGLVFFTSDYKEASEKL